MRPTLLLFALLLASGTRALAQVPAGDPRQHRPAASGPRPGSVRPDIPPSFPGGQPALEKFTREHLQYPAAAADQHISGKVVVAFTVQADGSLADFKVVSTPLGGGCEEEALRVARLMPKWEPARRRTEPIPVLATITLPFGATPALDDPKHRHQKN